MFLLAADQVMVLPQEQLEQRVPEVLCVLSMLVSGIKSLSVLPSVSFFLLSWKFTFPRELIQQKKTVSVFMNG